MFPSFFLLKTPCLYIKTVTMVIGIFIIGHFFYYRKMRRKKVFSSCIMKNNKTVKLWPYKYKKWSFPLIIIGIVCLIAYQKDVRPLWMNVKVFAMASTYVEHRYLQIVQTNIMDEIGFVSLLSGIGLMIFSQEKKEQLSFGIFRLNALMFALKTSFGIWILSYLLFYGYIIFPISMIIFLIFTILYYAYFKYITFKIGEN